MVEEEVKLLKTLPKHWQIAILDSEIVAYQKMLDFKRTDPMDRGCGTTKIWNWEILQDLKALRATL